MAVPFAVMYPRTVLTDGDALEPTVAHARPHVLELKLKDWTSYSYFRDLLEG